MLDSKLEAPVRLYRGRNLGGEWIFGGIVRVWSGRRSNPEETDEEAEYMITAKMRNYVVEQHTINEYTGMDTADGKPIFCDDLVSAEMEAGGALYRGIVRFGLHAANMCQEPFSYGYYIEWAKEEFLRKELGFWAPRLNVIGPYADNASLWDQWQKEGARHEANP